MPARKMPPTQELQEWLDSGLTQQQIADHISAVTGERISRSAVAVAIHRAGLEQRRPTYKEWLPWTVHAEHAMQYPAVMLRAYARSEEGQQLDKLPEDMKVRLVNWLADIDDESRPDGRVVVSYDQDEGFHYVKAKPGEHIIRRPKDDASRASRRKAV